MSISSVSASNNQYQTTNQTGYAQIAQNFQAIGTALQSGNLSSAQSALTTFQQSLPSNSSQTSNSQPFGKNSQANSDYQSMVSALQSGNLSSAQQSYSSLQSDLKSAHGHHHHRSSGATSSDTSTSTSTSSTAGTSALSSTLGLLDNDTSSGSTSATGASGNSLLNALA